jgi:hypothetical protein
MPEDERSLDGQECLAIEFADRPARDHKRIDGLLSLSRWGVFTPTEILELSTLIGQSIGFIRLLDAMGVGEHSKEVFATGDFWEKPLDALS